jgi:glyoxylase-like metal-dependent hydrolase (beta-lactamase superfamily II)
MMLAGTAALAALPAAAPAGRFAQPDARAYPDLFVWSDTCNVWVIREGASALLIDLGDGSVLDHLGEIGVRKVEWVLFTHHHREQCQGAPRLRGTGAKIGVPAAERALFERPADFRKMQVRLGDAWTVHGASFVRPPIEPIPVDRAFERMDTLAWRGREFWCVETRGNSPGSMSYLLRAGGRWLAFTGDLMLEGARLHTWFDSEWDYGFAAGVWALANSAAQVAGYDPAWLLPSHGPAIVDPRPQLEAFQAKLFQFERLLVRGYPVNSFASAVQDRISRPSRVAHVWQVSPQVFKFRGPGFFPNFYLVSADNGHALAVDCGLLDTNRLDAAIEGMRSEYGLKRIDAVIPTHMHGDHFLQAPHLRAKWGAEIWGLDRMAAVCEHPEWFDYAAPIQAYGNGVAGVRFDRVLADGESLGWQGSDLRVDWMPGQTEFALCVQGTIDGQKVAFTGDNIFGDPADASQNGHEAMVAHNSAVLEEGYIYGAEYLKRLRPDRLLGGHSYVMDQPAAFIERYRQWAYAMRDAFRGLSAEDDYRPWFDPFWVRAEPYRASLPPNGSLTLTLHLRNFESRPVAQQVEVLTPPGLSAEPKRIAVTLDPEARSRHVVRLHAAAATVPGVRLVAFDITRGGRRLGALFDAIIEVKPAPPLP